MKSLLPLWLGLAFSLALMAGCERHAVVGAEYAGLAKMSRVDLETNVILLEGKNRVLAAKIRILESENGVLKLRSEL